MRDAQERLQAWLDDVQLSNRLGIPHYANPGELKADVRILLEEVERLQWIEIRSTAVKNALEGKTIVDAALVQRLL